MKKTGFFKRAVVSSLCCLAAAFVLLTGCENVAQKKNGTQQEVYATPAGVYSLGELQKKYPDWFNSSGEITYPYTPETKEYQEADSYEKLCSLQDIPKDIVDHSDTETLLQAVEKYPLLDYSLYDTFQSAEDTYKENFYGYRILGQREDAYLAAWRSLAERNRKDLFLKQEGHLNEEINQTELELSLILTKHAWQQFSKEERKEVKALWKDVERKILTVSENAGLGGPKGELYSYDEWGEG